MNGGEYHVWAFLREGWHYPIERHIDAATAIDLARQAENHLGVERIIIVDSGDETCYEWTRTEGVTFPPSKKTC